MVSGAWVRGRVTASVCASVWLGSGVARADAPAALELEWQAPSGCPGRDTVIQRVEQLLGERSTREASAPLAVRELVSVEPDGRFRAELAMTVRGGSERTRVLEAGTCAEVVEASAVVLALAGSRDDASELDMPALAEPAEPAPKPAEAPPTVTASDAGTTPAPQRAELRGLGALGMALDFALASEAVPGVVLGAMLGLGSVAFGVRGSFFPEHASSVPGQPSQGVDISLLAAAPLACLSPFTLPLELTACAEFELGRLHAGGYGAPVHYERSSAWLAPGAGFAAAYPRRGRIRTRLGVDLLVPLAHTEFVLTGVGVAHRLPGIDPRIGLALEVAFP